MLWFLLACAGADNDPGPKPDPVPVPQTCTKGLDDPELSADLAAWVAGSNTLGVVVGIADADGFRVEGFGTTAPDGQAMPADAVFDIGSIQKSFRWMLVHRMATLGHIDLDDPVDAPGLDLQGASWRMLAMHATGLKHWDDTAFPGQVWDHMDEEYDYNEMVEFLGGDPLMDGLSPGQDMHYSNFGPMIAGEVLAQAHGTDARSLIQAELFDPLGLDDSAFQDGGTPPAGLVQGYWDGPDQRPHQWTQDPADNLALSSAAGWLQYSTACDVLKYSHGVHDPEFISTQAELRAQTVDVLDHGNDVGDAGAGLMTWPAIWGEGRWGHLGDGQHGHSSIFLHDEANGTAYVVLANVTAESIGGFEDPTTGETRDWMGDQYDTQVKVLGLVLP